MVSKGDTQSFVTNVKNENAQKYNHYVGFWKIWHCKTMLPIFESTKFDIIFVFWTSFEKRKLSFSTLLTEPTI